MLLRILFKFVVIVDGFQSTIDQDAIEIGKVDRLTVALDHILLIRFIKLFQIIGL